MAFSEKVLGQVTADEAGAAGNQYFHSIYPWVDGIL
jgi:hypothetical protein